MNFRLIALLNGTALLMFLSWYFGWFGLWDSLDKEIFWYFNQFIGRDYPRWGRILAFCNSEAFNMLFYLLVVGLFLWSVFWDKRDNRWYHWVAVAIVMLLTVALVNTVGHKVVTHKHASPTITLRGEGALRLTSFVKDFKFKDRSDSSFPGDHGIALIIVAAYMIRFAKRSVAIFSILFVILLSAPRIMVGAHWFTDVYFGGLCLVLAIVPWIVCTPIAPRAITFLEKGLQLGTTFIARKLGYKTA